MVATVQQSDALGAELAGRSANLFGRDVELDELVRLVSSNRARLVTLTGVGGVGKTRLALRTMEIARQYFSDGAHLVPLAAVPDDMLVGATVAQYFELGAVEANSARARLQRYLADRSMLLVLDNFEHVTGAADLIVDLLNVSPHLVVLITSRTPLKLFGEHVFDIAPLAVDSLESPLPPAEIRDNPAVRLFYDRAALAGAALDDSDLKLVADICWRLEGLPLAVELAAALTRALPLEVLHDRLDHRLNLLVSETRNVPERLKTMEASIKWSYELLAPAERELLQRLAVFTGGTSFEMAEAMANGRAAGSGYPWSGLYRTPYPAAVWWGFNPTVERVELLNRGLDHALPLPAVPLDPVKALQALVDQSLIRLDAGRDGTGRYVMLETIREYALERLRESGLEEPVRHTHAALMVAFSDATGTGLWTGLLRSWPITRVDDELGNLRVALAWTTSRGAPAAELAQRIACGLSLYWQLRGLVSEGIGWLDLALAAGPGADWCRTDCHITKAALSWLQGRDDVADEALQQAAKLARSIGMVQSEAQTAFYRALIAWRQGDLHLMKARVDEAFELFGQWQDIIGIGVCHLAYGVRERMLGNLVDADTHFADARALHGLVSYEWGMATGRYYGGEVARDRGDWRGAAGLLRDALTIYWSQGDFWGSGACAGGLATLAGQRGRKLVAARLFGASDALCQRVGALLPPTELRAYGRVSSDVRAQLGAPLYDMAFEEGQRATPEQCVRLALDAAAGLLGESIEEPWADVANEATRARAALAGLTPKRREILKLVIQGHEIKEIAHMLNRDYNTVDVQLKAIQQAFHVESRTNLIVHIYRNDLADLL